MKRVLAAVAVSLGVFPAGWALAHGSGEIEIFRYLLEEPGFFRTTALILGALVFLLGVFIAHQGRREWLRLQGEAVSSPVAPMTSFQLVAPGALFAAVGAGIILAAVLILPDRIETGPHDHPASEAMRPDSSDDGRTRSPR